jgi:Secretion system C-terminal sorting domain
MNKILTLVSFCLISAASLFSQIDPFIDFKKTVATERSANLYFFASSDSIEISTIFDASCNPLKTIKSKWTYSDKKLFYQDKDSFSYIMVGNVLRPASKTYSILRFDKQEWEDQTLYTFNYPNNNPYNVERITSKFNLSFKKWIKTTSEVFQLDKNGSTIAYESYDPYQTIKFLFHKSAYKYTDWGALKYFKRERPSNGDWRTDSINEIAYDAYRNKTSSTLTTYVYDRYDNQLDEIIKKDSITYSYNNGILVSRKTEGKYFSIDSFFYNSKNILISNKTFFGDTLGRIDTNYTNAYYFENFNERDLPQKYTHRRVLRGYNFMPLRDTAYWVTSFEQYITYNNNGQKSSVEFIASDPVIDYNRPYYKAIYKYCGETSTPSKEIYGDLAFTLSPNPTNNTLFIDLNENNYWNVSTQIADVLGNIIRLEKITHLQEMDVSNLPNGIYFLKIQMGNKMGVKKFVVNH